MPVRTSSWSTITSWNHMEFQSFVIEECWEGKLCDAASAVSIGTCAAPSEQVFCDPQVRTVGPIYLYTYIPK